MTLVEFLVEALAPNPHGQRRGQWFANCLITWRIDLSNNIPKDVDPFYEDEKLWAAVAWVRDNWDSSVQSSSKK